MKLSAQLGSTLPSPRLGSLGSVGKDAFAGTIESLMPAFTGKVAASVKEFPLAERSPKPILVGPTTATSSLTGMASEGKQHLVVEAIATPTRPEISDGSTVMTEGEVIEQVANSQISLRDSMVLEGKSGQSAAQESARTNRVKGAAILRPSTTKSADGLDASVIYSALHPQQKGHSIKGHHAEPADRPDIQPALNSVTQGIHPVATQQTGGPGDEISAGKAQMESRNDDPRRSGHPSATPASAMNTRVGNGLQLRPQQNTQPEAPPLAPGSNLNAGMLANQNLLEQAAHGNADHNVPASQTDVYVAKDGARETVAEMHSDAANQPNQNLLSMRAMQGKEDHDVPASPVGSHSLKEAERVNVATPATESVGAVNPAMQHESAAIIPVPDRTLHPREAAAESHRMQTNAAQLLQRMDIALPSSPVQLRADARHLDVGVTSAAFGWVEVRATASPSGRVDVALHVESNASAHVLTAQAPEIGEYAREHSVHLGQISVGSGTGDGARGNARSNEQPARSEVASPAKKAVTESVTGDMRLTDRASLISVRA